MTPTIIRDVTQGTPEWHAIRCGCFSASKAGITMGDERNPTLLAYIKTLAWERVYGPMEGGYTSRAMERGHEMEPRARDFFAFTRDVVVEEVGLVRHGDHPHVVWSPDGLYNDATRGIEAKAPLPLAWMETKRTGKVPAEYRWQCKWAIWTGGLEGLEFIAFHPRAGSLVVSVELSAVDRDAMESRVELLEPKVRVWTDILGNETNDRKEKGEWHAESTRSF